MFERNYSTGMKILLLQLDTVAIILFENTANTEPCREKQTFGYSATTSSPLLCLSQGHEFTRVYFMYVRLVSELVERVCICVASE